MASEGHFKYDALQPRQIRLFKLDLADAAQPLSGSLVTLRHPCTLDVKLINYTSSVLSWNDVRWMLKEGYDALSYTWGDPRSIYPLTLSAPKKVYKGGTLGFDDLANESVTVLIRHNLYALLRQLRQMKYSRYIWIDALCINQTDDAEKAIQIALMRFIYQEARRVFVWLGDASTLEEGAMIILPKLAKILQKTFDAGQKVDPEKPETFDSVGLPTPDHAVWLALGAIMMRPWFRRLWTLQEVVLPGSLDQRPGSIEILCGTKSVSWDDFNEFAVAARSHGIENWTITGVPGTTKSILNGYQSLYMIDICRDAFKRYRWGVSAHILLVVLRWREVTNPVDLIFGMLGLIPPGTRSRIRVDVSLPVQTVFTEFAKYYIQQQNVECILNHTSAIKKLDGLPSWVPNFASREEAPSLGSWWLGYVYLPNSIRDQKPHAGFELEGKWERPTTKHKTWAFHKNSLLQRDIVQDVLNADDPRQIILVPDTDFIQVSGIAIDEVVEVIDCNWGMDYPVDGFPSVEQVQQTVRWEAACLDLAKSMLKVTDGIPDLYVRTLTANLIIWKLNEETCIWWDKDERIDLLSSYREIMKGLRTIVKHGSQMYIPFSQGAVLFWGAVTRATRRRCFFATRNGRIGLGPSDTQVGDTVAVLFYCPTPYLFRRGPVRSRLVGEAYVHDLMYAQALHMLDRGQVEESQWIIE